MRKKFCQKESGTQAATAPAMSRPITMSRRTAAHSMTKTCAVEVKPAGERSRRQTRAIALDAHVHRCMTLHRPGDATVCLDSSVGQQLLPQEQPEQDCEKDDHQRDRRRTPPP